MPSAANCQQRHKNQRENKDPETFRQSKVK